jgi:hypothetical protein
MAKSIVRDFPFIGSDRLGRIMDVRKSQRGELRETLPSPLYWFCYPGGRKIFWNWVLVRDYLLNGDGPDHQRLVEEYMQTLPDPPDGKTPRTSQDAG